MKRTIPAAGLVVIPRSGHTINLEEPAAFNRAVGEFIAQVDAGRWSERNPLSLSDSALLPPGEREELAAIGWNQETDRLCRWLASPRDRPLASPAPGRNPKTRYSPAAP